VAPTVDRSALGPMTEIGRGGFAVVHELKQFSLPGQPRIAYKEFIAAPDPTTVANLTEVVDFRENLDPHRRQVLDGSAAWPLRLVVANGGVVGILMPLVPDDFFFVQALPSGKMWRAPSEAQWLIVDPAKAAAARIAVPASDAVLDRLVLCAKLAHTLGVLHHSGLVYGDLSLKNVLFATTTPLRIMLVDCDAATARTDVFQANSPDWVPPEIKNGAQKHQDVLTDQYKLALFILRCLKPGDRSSLEMDPLRMSGILDSLGVDMMQAALGADRSRRPTAKDWFRYLVDLIDALTAPPTVTRLDVDNALVLAGGTVTVEWSARGATSAVLATADGKKLDVDPDKGSVTVPILQAGALVLTVANQYGETVAATDPVFVFVPPRIEYVAVPEPSLPVLDTTAHRGLTEVLGTLAAERAFAPVVVLPDLMPLPDFAGAGPRPSDHAPDGPDSLAVLLSTLDTDATAVLEAAAESSRAAARRHAVGR
jgi:hypothetical protein